MKVILMGDVKDLGKEGEVVNVSDGHARNFLFPQNLAVAATADALKKIQEKEASVSRKTHRELSVMGDLASSLEGFEIIVREKVNEAGVLYAAVSEKAVSAALKKEGFDVESSTIVFKSPIKELGEYTVNIHLPHGFEADIKLIVEQK